MSPSYVADAASVVKSLGHVAHKLAPQEVPPPGGADMLASAAPAPPPPPAIPPPPPGASPQILAAWVEHVMDHGAAPIEIERALQTHYGLPPSAPIPMPQPDGTVVGFLPLLAMLAPMAIKAVSHLIPHKAAPPPPPAAPKPAPPSPAAPNGLANRPAPPAPAPPAPAGPVIVKF